MQDKPTIQSSPWSVRRVVTITLTLVVIVIGFWMLYRFYNVLFILLSAIVIGTVIRPIVAWLNRRGISQILGVIIVYFLLLAFVTGFILLLFPLVFDQASSIMKGIPNYYQSFQTWVSNSTNPLLDYLNQFLPNEIPGLKPVLQTAPEILESAEQALSYVATVTQVVFIAIVTLLLAFHWTLDGPRIIQSLLPMLPKQKREGISDLIAAIESKIGYFIAGQAVLCLVIGALALIAYLIIGLPNALVLALIAGVLEAVPMVGPALGAIPAGVIAFSVSPTKLIWVIVATVIIQLLENNLLVPRIMRKAVGVNPFVSLLSIFAFSTLFGIAGALMAIPIAAIIQLILQRFLFHPEEIGNRRINRS